MDNGQWPMDNGQWTGLGNGLGKVEVVLVVMMGEKTGTRQRTKIFTLFK
jgi:hypothetical protein